MIFLLATLLALVVAQLGSEQYAAVRTLMAGLGCTHPMCADFAASDPCPSPLGCTNGTVVSFNLNSRLSGSINGSALGVLTDLTYLLLAHLNLTTIPTQIGRLTALTYLNLFSLALTGTIPSQVGNLGNLTYLGAFSNKLTGTLPALDKLTKLAVLDISENAGLGGNMPSMPTSIRGLFASNCSFTALPPNLSNLTLTTFRVTHNKLTGAPVVPVSTNDCELQTNADTNCLDCLAVQVVVGSCICIPRMTACAAPVTLATTTVAATSRIATTTTVAASSRVATTAGATTATSNSAPTIANLTTVTASAPRIATTAGATTATSNSAPTMTTVSASHANSTTATTTLSSTTPLSPPTGGLEPWIVGVIIGGAVFALLLVGVAVFCVLKRRRAQQPVELKQPTPSPTYADVTDVRAPAETYGDVADVRGVATNAHAVKVSPQALHDAPESPLKF
jgi:hypothetical protein